MVADQYDLLRFYKCRRTYYQVFWLAPSVVDIKSDRHFNLLAGIILLYIPMLLIFLELLDYRQKWCLRASLQPLSRATDRLASLLAALVPLRSVAPIDAFIIIER